MLIALISVVGSGLVGTIGVLVHFLLKQGGELRDLIDRRHGEALAEIAEQGGELRDLIDWRHGEALAAIAEQREHADKLHREAMDVIAKQGERLVDLHLQAMAAVAALREHTAALGERTATPEAKAG